MEIFNCSKSILQFAYVGVCVCVSVVLHLYVSEQVSLQLL